MSEIVRAEALRGFRELVEELGGDADALLAHAGIAAASLADPDAYLPYRPVIAVVERAAATLECPDFGLRLAERIGVDMLGPLAVAMNNAETVRAALTIAQRFFHFHNPAVVFSVAAYNADQDFIGLELKMHRPPRCPQTFERGVATTHRFLAAVCGPSYRPKEVCFKHMALSPPAVYRAAFGMAPNFGAPHAGIAIARELVDMPLSGGNAQVRRIAEHFLETAAPAVVTDALAPRARVIIARLTRVGDCAQGDVARALGLHERTMQRRLQAEGATFEALRDDVRRELAHAHLAQRNVPLAHIAEMLGYAEPSAFTRACQRWFGAAPRNLRKQMTG